MQIGDQIRVKTSKGLFEGTLMPRVGLADDEHIVLKLATGYNIGISKKDIQKTEFLAKKTAPKSSKGLKSDSSKPGISIVTTGGTITSKVDYDTGGVKSLVKPEELLGTVPQLSNFAHVQDIVSPFNVMSEDMGPSDWAELAKVVGKELNKDTQGVVVTHGTDTLHYTSAALSFAFENLTKPIAVVGGQRSADRGSADGVQNLLCAAHYALSDIAEVAIVMHANTSDDYCIASRGTKVRKMHSSRRDAFRPINELPLAKVYPDGKLEVLNEKHKTRTNEKVKPNLNFEEKVALLKVYPGAKPELLDYYVSKKYRGLILEGTGFGHVPTDPRDKKMSWIPAVKSAVDAGLFIGVTTQTIYGRTSGSVYSHLRLLAEAGSVHLDDMLPETAYVKLSHVLGNTKKLDEARAHMLKNHAGEINDRIDADSYLY